MPWDTIENRTADLRHILEKAADPPPVAEVFPQYSEEEKEEERAETHAEGSEVRFGCERSSEFAEIMFQASRTEVFDHNRQLVPTVCSNCWHAKESVGCGGRSDAERPERE